MPTTQPRVGIIRPAVEQQTLNAKPKAKRGHRGDAGGDLANRYVAELLDDREAFKQVQRACEHRVIDQRSLGGAGSRGSTA